MNKPPITAFSSTTKTEAMLKRLQRETGKNRSQIIRDLIFSATDQAGAPGKNVTSDSSFPPTPEIIIKSFFELLTADNVLIQAQAVITRGDRILIVLPKKSGTMIRYSTWEFPSVMLKNLSGRNDLVNKIKKDLGIRIKIDGLVLGRLVPEKLTTSEQMITLVYHCHITAGKISPFSTIKEIKWISQNQLYRYFSHSVGDTLITWLSRLK